MNTNNEFIINLFFYYLPKTLWNVCKKNLKKESGFLNLYFCCVWLVVSGKSECTLYDLSKEGLLYWSLHRWLTDIKGFCNTAYKLPEGQCENISLPDSIAKNSYCYQDLLNPVLLTNSTFSQALLLQVAHKK